MENYVRNRKRKYLRWIARHLLVDRNRDISKSILLAGAARSGTTWITELIASQVPTRIMFEPFYPAEVPEYAGLNYYQYIRSGDTDPGLYAFVEKLFSGNIRNKWIDKEVEHIFPKLRVVKAVRANFLLRWLDFQFPLVPKIFLIRHPCAVIVSRISLGWSADQDLQYILSQPKLVQDYLSDKGDIVYSVNSEIEKQALLWCLLNYVPLKQYEGFQFNCFYYEKLVLEPEVEIPRLFKIIELPYQATILTKLNRPSSTALYQSAVVTGENMVDRWKTKLDSNQIKEILSVVNKFGLDYPKF